MEVFFNVDKTIEGRERFETYFSSEIKQNLARFEDKVTRIEVHVSDENGTKKGVNDKKCVMEVRPRNFKPVVATSFSDTFEKAISSALKKVNSSLTTLVGKVQEVR